MKRFLSVIIFLSSSLFFLQAGTYGTGEIQEIYESESFSLFYSSIYNATPISTIESAYDSLKDSIASTGYTEEAKIISLGRASMIFAKHLILEDYCKDLSRAESLLNSCLGELERVQEKDRGLEFLLVEGETYGSLYLLDQTKYLFTHGMHSNNITNTIWAMDPDHIRSILLKCNQLIYTPPLFGGNVKKARKLLEGIIGDDLLPVDQYTVYSCLGMIEKRLRHEDDAYSYYELALSVYPGNRYIKQLMAEL